MSLPMRLKAAASILFGSNSGKPASYMVTPSGVIVWQGQNSQELVDKGYCTNDLVYSIINLITTKAKVAPFTLNKIVNEKAFKELKALELTPDALKYASHLIELKGMALEPVKGYDPVKELLTYPNEEDTFSDLIEQWVGFKLTTGNQFTYAPRIEAGNNKGKPSALYSTPAQYMSIMADTTMFPSKALAYQLYYGVMWKFSKDEIVHDKFFNPKFNANGGELYGMSPLLAAARNITRSNEAKKASVSMYENGGPAGVLHIDSSEFGNDDRNAQAAQLKAILASSYEGSGNRNKIATSGLKTGWTSIGLSPVDLDIIKAEMWDLRSLCNILGVPSQLLNDPENKSFNNTKEGEKSFTSRAVVPHLVSIRDNLNRAMYTKWGYDTSYQITFDLSVFPELQADSSTQWSYVKELPITWAEKMKLMNIPFDNSNPAMGETWIGNGLQPMDNQMLDNTGDY